MVLLSYLLTLVKNSSIILLILLDPRLQMPMYFFLDNLSLLDFGVTCTTVPQLLTNLCGPEKTIAFWGWITQIYLFNWTACAECILLAVIAIDHYVATCQPLQYTLIMSPWVSLQMEAPFWSSGLANSLLQTIFTLQLPLCGPHTLDHFCEVPVLIKLTCGIIASECALLAMMAIYCYGAICQALQYTLIMCAWMCVQMEAGCWSSWLMNSLLQTTLTLRLPLCGHLTLNHFCEVPVLIKLACGDTSANQLALTSMTIPFGVMSSLLVVISYIFIARAILKLSSAEGRHKALSTCSSHLLVLTMYFGLGIFFYLKPSAKSTQDKFKSFFYCVVTPLLYPLIYTLRNKDVKTAWTRILQIQGKVMSLKAQSLPVY
ncbi:Olfactory receptor 2G6 [Heterocephalus glaber]|uniref:Olfactory receptor 2G6 n=1 Tax=Heterocephalus glaber TaxID=10181 RepID=G5B1U9_HETGA|nr:Olfactory receptor 2G6 [Heterocephalus glaber]